MLPYVEVTQLPSSASFYSAITHPLGLRYLRADPSSIVYGTDSPGDPSAAIPVFEVRSTHDSTDQLKRSRLVLSATSPSAVSDFLAAAQRANPDLQLIGSDNKGVFLPHADSGEVRVQIKDLDGNIMEVVYLPPPDYTPQYGRPSIRRTQSTTKEVSRILDWNHDVVTSEPAPSVAGSGSRGGSQAAALSRRLSGAAGDEPYTVLRRSVTTVETSSPRQTPAGISPGAVVGTVLGALTAGAAIGGAWTYMNMRNDRDRAPQQEFDAPGFQRRQTFPDRYPQHGTRFVEVERTVEKIRFPEDYPPVKSGRYYPPPAYMARYSQVGGGRSREVEELDDRSSRHSSRHSNSGRTRTRSEAGSTRQPLMLANAEHRSNAGSRHTATPKMIADHEYRSQAGSRHSSNLLPEADHWSRAPSKHSTPRSIRHHEAEAESYVSARSRKTESTIRPPPPPLVQSTTLPTRSAGPSRHSSAGSRVPVSRAASYASARLVPLPGSGIGSSHAEWDDDNDSVAPSDSISCVGSRNRSRSYR